MARTPFALDIFVGLWKESGRWNSDYTAYLFDDYASFSEVKYWASVLKLNMSLTASGALEVEACSEVSSRIAS